MSRNGVDTSKIQKLISDFACLTEEERRIFLISCIVECKVLVGTFQLQFPDWKVCFFRAEDIFPHQICTLGKTVLASPPHLKMYIFQVYFPNSCARKIFSSHYILSSLVQFLGTLFVWRQLQK